MGHSPLRYLRRKTFLQQYPRGQATPSDSVPEDDAIRRQYQPETDSKIKHAYYYMYMYTSELLLHVTGDPRTYLYTFDVRNNKTLWSVYCNANVMVAPVGYVLAVCINVGI